jgi:hypothetical protein
VLQHWRKTAENCDPDGSQLTGRATQRQVTALHEPLTLPNLLDRSVTIDRLIKLIAVRFMVYVIILNQLLLLVLWFI